VSPTLFARARHLLLATVMACGSGMAGAGAHPQELRASLPTATLAGSKLLMYWGFAVYQARLWIAPGFNPAAWERHAFALELTYQRDFRNRDIAQRSLDEMRRLGATDDQLGRWQSVLRSAFPDVRKGDRITGVHEPGTGTTFLTNGRTTGTTADPEFGRLFFGIWLSPRTSEPALREALLANSRQ